MAKIRLSILDDREVFGQGLAMLLGAEPNLEVVRVTKMAQEIVEQHGKHQPDIILISSELSESGSIERIQCLHEKLPGANIICFTDSEARDDLVSCFRAGARACLSTNISRDNLISAIKLVAEGKLVISPQMSDSALGIFESFHGHDYAMGFEGIASLTRQEKIVLGLVRQGLTNKEIANNLCISDNTVKVHMRNIMEKFHAHTRQQAVALLSEIERPSMVHPN